jgi:hypothetical protein
MNEQLSRLLAVVGSHELTDSQQSELESLVRNDVQACRQYIRHVHLHASLPRIFGYSPTNSFPAELQSHGKPVEQQPVQPLQLPISRRGIGGFPWLSSSLAACFVALVFYGSFVMLAWNLRPSPNTVGYLSKGEKSIPSSTRRQVVATMPSNRGVQNGELVELTVGQVQLTFADGAQVMLVGPCKFIPESSHRGRLELGRLVAQVPARAIGFTVVTPTAEIVDLGTEFGVETDESGATEVQVFKGKVELRQEIAGNDPSSAVRPITLSAGAARRVERTGIGGRLSVREVALTPERFPVQRSDNASAPVRQIVVEGAYASSTHPALNVDDMIRGHGLKGEKHSADWHGAMWHSDYGKIKNVIVAFDLARSHRLNSMKVWNFNDNPGDGRFAWVGVKQADIYVSTSGKGDPLSQPASWKLVADDQQFTPATGKDDYATPTVIPLGDVEGRFVAMVIDDALGRDPRPANNGREPDIVGLSEVQFFGSRVEASKPKITQQKK